MEKGFYIRNKHGKHGPRYIGKTRIAAARELNRVDVHEGEWVEFCYGLDVDGVPAWSNVDHLESLIDLMLETR